MKRAFYSVLILSGFYLFSLYLRTEVAAEESQGVGQSGQVEVSPQKGEEPVAAGEKIQAQPVDAGAVQTAATPSLEESKALPEEVIEPAQEEAEAAEGSTLNPGYVTLDFKDADIRNVLRIISFKSGVNIVATPEVVGNVTVRLVDVPWEKALETIVTTYSFGYEWLNDKVIMVSTLQKLSEQRKEQEDAASKEPLDTQAFILNFTKAEDIRASIEKLISPRGKLTIESKSNTIIITETKSNLLKVTDIIKKLDRMTPQVVIEAKIIETTLGDAERLGIDWSIQVAVSGASRPTTFPFQTGEYFGNGKKMFPTIQTPDNLQTQNTTIFNDAGVPIGLTQSQVLFNKLVNSFPGATDSLFTFGTLSFDQFRMVLEILDQRTNTKVLSNPRITTLNNQQAKILVGSIVPIPNYEYSKDTGTRVVSGYSEQQIGIGLTVTPNINERDYVTLNIKPTIDQITGFTGPNNERPIVSTRQAETNVMIKDGQTLVIGGLIAEKKIKYKKKVPFLGDIPVLDYIFSKQEDTIDRTELLIFITPHVVKESDFDPATIAKLQDDMGYSTDKPAKPKKKAKAK